MKNILKRDSKVKAVTRTKSLKSKLLEYMGGIIVVSLLLLSFVSLEWSTNTVTKISTEKFQSEVRGLSEVLEYQTKSIILELDGYVWDANLRDLLSVSTEKSKEKEFKAIADSFSGEFNGEVSRNEYLKEMFVANGEGIIYSAVHPENSYKDISNTDYFQMARERSNEKGVYIISNVQKSQLSNEMVVVVTKAIKNKEGNFTGIIAKELSVEMYVTLLNKFENGSSEYYITDKAGNIVYHANKELIGGTLGVKEVDEIAKNIEISNSTIIDYKYNEEDMKAAYDVVPTIRWKVFSADYIDNIEKPVRNMRLFILIFAAILLLIALVIVYLVSMRISSPIKKITEEVKKVAGGDLTIKVKESKDSTEILELSKGFNTMIDNLASLIGETLSTAQKVEEASTNLCAISEEVAASNSELTRQVSMISESTTKQATDAQISNDKTIELGNSIEELESKNSEMERQGEMVVSSLTESNEKIKYLMVTNNKTTDSFKAVKSTVEELISKILDISNIIGVIDNISKQTSLLSLNASIESARAGEAGRGFAVVAAEIRGLADEVQNATNNISNIIKSVQGIVGVTKETLVESEELANGQISAYMEVEESFKTMEEALKEMIYITEVIGTEIDNVNSKKQEVLQSIEDVASEAEEIASVTEEVNQSIEEQGLAFDNVSSSAESLIDYSENVKKSIERFTV